MSPALGRVSLESNTGLLAGKDVPLPLRQIALFSVGEPGPKVVYNQALPCHTSMQRTVDESRIQMWHKIIGIGINIDVCF